MKNNLKDLNKRSIKFIKLKYAMFNAFTMAHIQVFHLRLCSLFPWSHQLCLILGM